MTSLPRKVVKPSVEGARIPDPSHPGLPIRPEGTEVVWDSHWIHMHRRGDVVIVEPEPLASTEHAEPPAPVA